MNRTPLFARPAVNAGGGTHCMPSHRITAQHFHYTPADCTDLRAKFQAIIAEQESAKAAKEAAAKAVKRAANSAQKQLQLGEPQDLSSVPHFLLINP